jgi:hypothetical protein
MTNSFSDASRTIMLDSLIATPLIYDLDDHLHCDHIDPGPQRLG